MRSLNKTLLLISSLLINVFCVTCPSSADLERCMEELYIELKNVERCESEIFSEFSIGEPLDDLLHGFLYIKYHTVFWNSKTNKNENVYCGDDEPLTSLASGYYSDLFYTILDVGLPQMPSPQEFCYTNYENMKENCLSEIEAMGCAAYLQAGACLEKLYFYWKKPMEPEQIIDTENISDEHLLEAIYRGSDRFRYLSEQNLIEALSSDNEVFHSVSDSQLLEDDGFNRSDYFDPFNGIYTNIEQHIGYREYQRHYKNYLYEVRFRRYGIGNVSYKELSDEYIRRSNARKAYGTLYAMHLYGLIKDNCDSTNLPDRASYCEKHVMM